MRCPHCDNRLLQKSGTSTRVRIHGALELGDDGVCRTRCFWCKGDVQLPLILAPSAPANVEEERFILRPK